MKYNNEPNLTSWAHNQWNPLQMRFWREFRHLSEAWSLIRIKFARLRGPQENPGKKSPKSPKTWIVRIKIPDLGVSRIRVFRGLSGVLLRTTPPKIRSCARPNWEVWFCDFAWRHGGIFYNRVKEKTGNTTTNKTWHWQSNKIEIQQGTVKDRPPSQKLPYLNHFKRVTNCYETRERDAAKVAASRISTWTRLAIRLVLYYEERNRGQLEVIVGSSSSSTVICRLIELVVTPEDISKDRLEGEVCNAL